MPIVKCEYQCPFTFKNGHLQTLYAKLARNRRKVRPMPVKLGTPDGDELELFTSKVKHSQSLVIISHGLESHGKEAALLALAQVANDAGHDAITWSMRACGKRLNKTRWFYNGCDYADLQYLIDIVETDYKAIYLVGFSLGGSITANYLGREGAKCNRKIKGSFLISPPLELNAFHESMNSPLNHFLYQRRVVKSLLDKFTKKTKFIDFGPDIDVERVKQAKTVDEIEEHLFAPMHGYESAKQYRTHAAALPYLKQVTVPLYILSAEDDPFIDARSLPYRLAENSEFIYLEVAKNGGHTGFVNARGDRHSWYERRFLWFLEHIEQRQPEEYAATSNS